MKKEKNENLTKMDGKPMATDVKPMKQGLLSQIFHLYYDCLLYTSDAADD